MRNVGKTGVGVVSGLVLAASAVLAQAEIERPLGPRGGGRCGERLVRSLELTVAQEGALATLREETAEAVQPIVEQLHALREQIDVAVAADAPDPCAIGGFAMFFGLFFLVFLWDVPQLIYLCGPITIIPLAWSSRLR